MTEFSQFWKVSLSGQKHNYIFVVKVYLYLLVEKTMFTSHVNLFSYIITTILYSYKVELIEKQT